MTGEPISRRRALALIGLGTASVAAGAAGWATGLGAPPGGGRLAPDATGQDLAEPQVLASRDGLLDVRLSAAPSVRLAGRDTRRVPSRHALQRDHPGGLHPGDDHR